MRLLFRGNPQQPLASDGHVLVDVPSAGGLVQFDSNGNPIVAALGGGGGGGGGTGGQGVIGSGSPQGVVTATPGTVYKDTTSVGGGLWIKVTGSGNTGWENLIA